MRVEPGAAVDTPPDLRLFEYQDGPYFLTRGDGPWGERDWTYDRIGNRLTETRDRSGTPETDTYAHTPNGGGGNTPLLGQVLLAPSGTADYAWDPAGNLDALTRGANHLDLTFDAASRMSVIDRDDGGDPPTVFDTALFRYDGRSFLRTAEDSASTATVEPLYDSSGLLHALLEKASPTGPERRHTFEAVTPGYAWPATLALLGLILVTELIPFVGGRGAEARFDWSFLYVTMHFVLLPLAAVAHVLWNVGALAISREGQLRERLLHAGSVVVPLAYLGLLYLRPVFSFSAQALWESFAAQPPWA